MGGPDLVEAGSGRSCAAQPGGHDGEQGASSVAGVLEVVGQVGVEGDGVALGSSCARRRRRSDDAPAVDEGRSRARRARASAGRRGRRCAAPGASMWRRARRAGRAAAGSGPRRRGRRRRRVRRSAARTMSRRRPRRAAAAGRAAGRARRRCAPRPAASGWSPPLDLAEHRRADAGALGEVAQARSIASRSARTRGPTGCAYRHTIVRYRIHAACAGDAGGAT